MKVSHADSPKLDEERAMMTKVPYASTVGSLMYAMIATRSDIAFVVGVVSRYMANLGKRHWEVAKCIMRYMKGTVKPSLMETNVSWGSCNSCLESSPPRHFLVRAGQ